MTILFVIFASGFVYGQSLNPPDTYDELLEKYKDMAEIAQKYKGLYEEAESDLEEALKLQKEAEEDLTQLQQLREKDREAIDKLNNKVDDLSKLVESQSDIIDDLLNKKQLGVITGLNLTPGNLKNTGVLVGFTYNF